MQTLRSPEAAALRRDSREAEREARERELGGQRRAVPCRDHTFDESLVCRCGASWWTHQIEPRPCPLDARGRNRHSVPLAAKRRADARGH